jgi:hypothetical protein
MLIENASLVRLRTVYFALLMQFAGLANQVITRVEVHVSIHVLRVSSLDKIS